MSHGTTESPRSRRRGATEGRILDAALDLVASGGLEALSMARLADAAHYTPGALYRYFGSKDALLAAMVARILAEARDALAAGLGALPPRAGPLVKVFALARAYGAFARSRPHGFGLLALTLAEPRVLLEAPAHAGVVTGPALAALEVLAGALGEAEAAGQLGPGDSAERTLCLFAALQGLLQLRKRSATGPRLLDVDGLCLSATRALLVGWGAAPRSVDAARARALALPFSQGAP